MHGRCGRSLSVEFAGLALWEVRQFSKLSQVGSIPTARSTTSEWRAWMTGWVLIMWMGSLPLTVSGIESERECRDLADRIRQEWTLSKPMQCFPYRAAYRF